MRTLPISSIPKVLSTNKDGHPSSSPPGVWFAILILYAIAVSPLATMAEPRGEIRVVENWRPDVNVLGHNVLQYLVEYAIDKNELSPALAASWEWKSDRVLELCLRKGVRFHNGEPFDAHSVKFNFDYQRQHNPTRGVQVYMRNVREIQVVDNYTVRMILDEPDFLLLNRMMSAGPFQGWVIGAPKYMEKVGWEEFLKRPVGTGPYAVEGVIDDYRKVTEGETYATLVANKDYWQPGRPKIGRIGFINYSPKTALEALIKGDVDLVTSLIPKDTLSVEESPFSKIVKGRNDLRFTTCSLNLRSPNTVPLRDLRVRKALNYSVNKAEMLRYAFKGNAVKMRGPLTKKSGVDLSGTLAYEWNIPLARSLLKEAGYGNGFRMKMYYQEKDFLIAQFLQRFFSLINVKSDIIPIQWEWIVRHVSYPNTRAGYSWKDEDWWVIIDSEPAHFPEIMAAMFEWGFHSNATFQTVADFLMEPLNQMYQELKKTRKREERFQIYKKANEYIADQALWLFTMAPLSLYGVNEELEFIPHPSQYLYLDYSFVTDKHWSIQAK